MPFWVKSPIKWRQRPDMTLAVDWDVKHQLKKHKKPNLYQFDQVQNVIAPKYTNHGHAQCCCIVGLSLTSVPNHKYTNTKHLRLPLRKINVYNALSKCLDHKNYTLNRDQTRDTMHDNVAHVQCCTQEASGNLISNS